VVEFRFVAPGNVREGDVVVTGSWYLEWWRRWYGERIAEAKNYLAAAAPGATTAAEAQEFLELLTECAPSETRPTLVRRVGPPGPSEKEIP
jgi:hypothetical protein